MKCNECECNYPRDIPSLYPKGTEGCGSIVIGYQKTDGTEMVCECPCECHINDYCTDKDGVLL